MKKRSIRRTNSDRLARCAGRQQCPRRKRKRKRADHSASLDSARTGDIGHGRLPAETLRYRKQAHHALWDKNATAWQDFYVVSMSARTIVFKGMVLAPNLSKFYLDFQNPDFKTAVALFHQRFSTNTFPSWRLAQPFRFLCHNGEINTVRGNINWMNARRRAKSCWVTISRNCGRLLATVPRIPQPSTMRSSCW